MEEQLGRLVWLVAGSLLTIVFSNFINDPIKEWRSRRTKRSSKERAARLRGELEEAEKYTHKQAELALSLLSGMNEAANHLLSVLQTLSGGLALVFLSLVVRTLQGQAVFNPALSVVGVVLSLMFFIFFTILRSLARHLRDIANQVVHFEAYKAVTNERIRDLEQRASK
jgi:uncharacterized membrane protein